MTSSVMRSMSLPLPDGQESQLVHLRALRALKTLVEPEKFGAWLIGIAVRTCLDWLKSSQRTEVSLEALQSAAGGILGGSRMQYHLRQSLTSIDALLFGRPEVIVTFAALKFHEKTLELKDQTAIDMIKLQLSGFEQFIRRVSAKE